MDGRTYLPTIVVVRRVGCTPIHTHVYNHESDGSRLQGSSYTRVYVLWQDGSEEDFTRKHTYTCKRVCVRVRRWGRDPSCDCKWLCEAYRYLVVDETMRTSEVCTTCQKKWTLDTQTGHLGLRKSYPSDLLVPVLRSDRSETTFIILLHPHPLPHPIDQRRLSTEVFS